MIYLGGKAKLGKYILPIINRYRNGRCWVEPFVGGGNMISQVDGHRIGGDINKWAIQGLISIRDYLMELPRDNTEFTEADYKLLRYGDEYKHKGYAGFSYSFGGKWLGGWARGKNSKNFDRDYVSEAYRLACKKSKLIQGVELYNVSYKDLVIPKNSLIYCDPPYRNTTKYSSDFDHDEFFNWCRVQNSYGNKIFVSEYSAPNDFLCVFEKPVKCLMFATRLKDSQATNRIERLFTLE